MGVKCPHCNEEDGWYEVLEIRGYQKFDSEGKSELSWEDILDHGKRKYCYVCRKPMTSAVRKYLEKGE